MTKKIVWVTLFFALALPFIFQTTFYPFFRFGMFAEPVRFKMQEERFVLVKISPAGQAEPYVPNNIGMGKSKLDYLLRNHYYRNEMPQFLDELSTLLPDSLLHKTIKVFRIVGQDTSVVGEIVKPK